MRGGGSGRGGGSAPGRGGFGLQRIGSGSLRGRKLLALPDGVPGLRPTSSRVREAICDRLGDQLVDACVLDVFAGSGALSIEALSRGARRSVLVERDARVARHLLAQLAALDLTARTAVHQGDALAVLAAGRPSVPAGFDVVFVDPPFASPHIFSPVLAALCDHGWLAPGAVIVCERERVRGAAPDIVIPATLAKDATRIYGQAQIEFLSRRPSLPPSAAFP